MVVPTNSTAGSNKDAKETKSCDDDDDDNLQLL